MMPGLFNFGFDTSTPEGQQAHFATSLALLGARKSKENNTGQNILASLLAGQQVYSNAVNNKENRELKRMQIQSQIDANKEKIQLAREKEDEAKRLQSFKELWLGGSNPSSVSMLPNQNSENLQNIPKNNLGLSEKYSIPKEAVEADFLMNNGKGLADMIFKRGTPNMQEKNGYLIDMNKAKEGFMPSAQFSSDGKGVFSVIGQNGMPVVMPMPGALESYSAFKNIDESAKANFDTQEMVLPNGSKILTTKSEQLRKMPSYNPLINPSAKSNPLKSLPGESDIPRILSDEMNKEQQRYQSFLKNGDQESAERSKRYISDLSKEMSNKDLQGNFNSEVSGIKIQNDLDKQRNSEQLKLDITSSKSKVDNLLKATQSIDLIDKAITHPGRKTSTGISGYIDPRNYIRGTDAKDFVSVLDQIKGKNFLEAFESLKGGGAITELEGQKATDAIARLNTNQSDSEFKKSLVDLKDIYSLAKQRAENTISGGSPLFVPQNKKQEAQKLNSFKILSVE